MIPIPTAESGGKQGSAAICDREKGGEGQTGCPVRWKGLQGRSDECKIEGMGGRKDRGTKEREAE